MTPEDERLARELTPVPWATLPMSGEQQHALLVKCKTACDPLAVDATASFCVAVTDLVRVWTASVRGAEVRDQVARHNKRLECSVAQALGILRDALCPAEPGLPLARDLVTATVPVPVPDDTDDDDDGGPLILEVTKLIGVFRFHWPLQLSVFAGAGGRGKSRIAQAEFLRAHLTEPLLVLCDALGSALLKAAHGNVVGVALPPPEQQQPVGLGPVVAPLYVQVMQAKDDIRGIVHRASSFGG
jgi:hypothetical protein